MKHYGSPRWTGELLDCSMPMTFDTYNKCSFNCLYCFSYFQKGIDNQEGGHKDYQTEELGCVDLARIKRMFTGESKTQFSEYIKQKRVMQWGGLADQFDMYERQTGMTLQLLKFFDEIDYPLSFSTKSTWFTKDSRYMDIIKKHAHNWHFKFSIINWDPETAKIMEKGVDSPQERIEAIKRIADLGCHVTLRLRPFIIGFTNKNNDHLKLIEAAKNAGADSISTEFFCLEQRADGHVKDRYEQMSKIIGFDLITFYKQHSLKRGYLRLNYDIKKKYVKEMKDKCDELGIRFHISDAHHKEKCSNGSCCGLPCSFNYSRGQITEALVIARDKGEVRFRDIEKGLDIFKGIPWSNANGMNTGSSLKRMKLAKWSLYDFVKNNWNDPNNLNSPYKYFQGVIYPKGIDEDGNIIYKYDYKKAEL